MSDGHGAVGDARKAIWEAQAACLPPNDYGKRRGDAGDLAGPQIGADVAPRGILVGTMRDPYSRLPVVGERRLCDPAPVDTVTLTERDREELSEWGDGFGDMSLAGLRAIVAECVARHVAPLAEQVDTLSDVAETNAAAYEHAAGERDASEAKYAALVAHIEKIRELHAKTQAYKRVNGKRVKAGWFYCAECNSNEEAAKWPCPTIEALAESGDA